MINLGLDPGYRVELSTRNINRVMLGHFKGLTCDYETLYKSRKESDSRLEVNMDAREERLRARQARKARLQLKELSECGTGTVAMTGGEKVSMLGHLVFSTTSELKG